MKLTVKMTKTELINGVDYAASISNMIEPGFVITSDVLEAIETLKKDHSYEAGSNKLLWDGDDRKMTVEIDERLVVSGLKFASRCIRIVSPFVGVIEAAAVAAKSMFGGIIKSIKVEWDRYTDEVAEIIIGEDTPDEDTPDEEKSSDSKFDGKNYNEARKKFWARNNNETPNAKSVAADDDDAED